MSPPRIVSLQNANGRSKPRITREQRDMNRYNQHLNDQIAMTILAPKLNNSLLRNNKILSDISQVVQKPTKKNKD